MAAQHSIPLDVHTHACTVGGLGLGLRFYRGCIITLRWWYSLMLTVSEPSTANLIFIKEIIIIIMKLLQLIVKIIIIIIIITITHLSKNEENYSMEIAFQSYLESVTIHCILIWSLTQSIALIFTSQVPIAGLDCVVNTIHCINIHQSSPDSGAWLRREHNPLH